MALILDADSLIKLNRVGVLELVARVFECIIPEAVYLEAVVNARARGYADAEAIDRTVQELIEIQHMAQVGTSITSRALGTGEIEVLALAIQSNEDSIIVSDDLGFLDVVRQIGIRYVTPISLIPQLTRVGIISTDESRKFIESSRPLTNERNYRAALSDLEASGK